jgi:16S rRNA (uracil1498-N3)-methyltransferase
MLPIVPLEVWLPTPRQGKKLLLSPMGKSLRDFSQPDGEIFLLIGPEGGLAPEEEALALSCGFEAMKLGPRILRTETAGLAAISALHALWGDFF